MKKIDLHVHSKYSGDSQNAVIKALGSRESYVEPEEIYDLSMKRGMDYVTITDHDTIDGCLYLKNIYPDKVVMGVESTVYFPEDGCPIHLLLYGLDRRQFEIVEKLRTNIYELRTYLQGTNIAHSVAHTTYRLSDKFSIEHIEKLLLLFDVFEGINGNRNEAENSSLMEVIKSLTPANIYNLSIKHKITPYSSNSWIKGITGGTDDHSGIFVGTTYTSIHTNSVDDAVAAIRRKKTEAAGSSRNHKGFAFEIFKGAYDNFNSKGGSPEELVNQISAHVLKESSFSLKNRYKLHRMRKSKVKLYRLLSNIITESDKSYPSIDEKMNHLYSHIVDLSDEITSDFFNAVFNSFYKGNLGGTLKVIPRTFASSLIYIPAMFALKYMNKDRDFHREVHNHFVNADVITKQKKKILWFTDTINDLNGVAVTLRNIGWLAHKRGDDLHIVSSVMDDEDTSLLPPNLINLKPLVSFKLPYYEKLTVKVPSVLGMLEALEEHRPDEVFISSPSIVGLYGLLYSRIFGIKCTTVYHTDFTMQAKNLIGDNSPLLKIIEKYTKWFHEVSDRILVPTAEYIDILMKRGFDREKMDIFHRGIDTNLFQPQNDAKEVLSKKYGITDGINLLYAGRVSEDKNVEFLIEAVSPLFNDGMGNLNLIFAGDGPYLNTLKEKHAGNKSIHFLGEIPNQMLPAVYSGCDLLVFPSETDTFGMVVLEAQACGTPALVSDVGGPKNIVQDEITGYVLSTANPEIWTEKLKEIIPLIRDNDKRYVRLSKESRQHVIKTFDVNRILDNYIVNNDHYEESPIVENVLRVVG